MISAAMPYGCGALTALVTGFHSTSFCLEYVLEAHNMKSTVLRSRSMIATFMSILLIASLMSGCRPATQETPPVDTNGSAAAERVVREYFNCWNGKNVAEMERRMTPDRTGITWELDKLEYVNLISINARESSEENKKVFDVVFDIRFKNGDGGGSGLKDGKLT